MSKIPFLELKTQFRAIESEVRGALDNVFERSRFILGEETAAFEIEFAAYIGSGYAIGVGSGTDAIHLALRALEIGPGDEVVTVANTCVPTVAGIASAGATPVLADVDDVTLTLDPRRLEEAITPSTKAVVPVHLYGHSADMDGLLAITKPRGIPIVEDCAQAHGAVYKDRRCGSLGTLGAFSFYPSKNLGAYGDGGAVTTDDPALAERLRKLRNYGAKTRYEHVIEGVNSRLDELQAAVLRVKLRRLDGWNAERLRIAAGYGSQLQDIASIRLPEQAPWAQSCHHLYAIRSPGRDALRTHLEQLGIGTEVHYPVPIHRQEAYAALPSAAGSFPIAEAACNQVLSLPMYPEMTDEMVTAVARGIAEFAG